MNPCELTMGVTALANAIANKLSDEDLGVVASVYTQLGDTLNAILIQRVRCQTLRDQTTASNTSDNNGGDGS